MQSKRVSSGIPALDRIFGGLRVGDNVVWHMESGGFMEVFESGFLKTSRRQGHRVVLVTVNASPKTVLDRMKGVANHPDVIVVDGFSWGKGEGARLFAGYYDSVYPKYRCQVARIEEPQRMEAFIRTINEIEENMPPGTRYLFDSLTGMGHLWGGEEPVLTFFTRQCPRLFDLDTVAYWILEKSAHSAAFRAQINHITQVAVELSVRESTPFLTVLKAQGREDSSTLHPRPFQVHRSRVDFPEEGKGGLELLVGPRIRALRLRKGMSQVELARSIGVSPSTISQVEGQQILLSLPALVRVAKTLDASLDAMVQADERDSVRPLCSREQRTSVRLSGFHEAQLTAQLITPWNQMGNLEAYDIRLQPGARLQGHFFLDKREEFGFLVEGEARLQLEGRELRMLPGDGIHLIQEIPDAWLNPQDAEARFVWVLRG
jgi:transcriptional regulator with XRE-family HTH domain/KaiC/GvpD/RAD55 family RecA-like ATPase